MRKVFVSTLCLLAVGCGATPSMTTPADFSTKQIIAPYGAGVNALVSGAAIGPVAAGMLPPTFTYGIDYGYPFTGATAAGMAYPNAIGVGALGAGISGFSTPFAGWGAFGLPLGGLGAFGLPYGGLGAFGIPWGGLGYGAFGLPFGGYGFDGFGFGGFGGMGRHHRRIAEQNDVAFRPAGSKIWRPK